jgi:Uma2 family endonuclease
MTAIDTLLLRKVLATPSLPDFINTLQQKWEEEQLARHAFYNWVTLGMKVEFIEGEIVLHSPVTKKTNVVTKNLLLLMDTHVDMHDLGFVGVEKIMTRFTRNDYEPDLCFFKKEKSDLFKDEQTIFPVPDMVVEILSRATEARDRGVKFLDYAQHGVTEYWIIDTQLEEVEQYILDEDEYVLKGKYRKGTIESSAVTGFKIPVKAIFSTKENLKALRTLG